MNKNVSFSIREMGKDFGVQVVDLDLSVPLSDGDFSHIHQAYLDHQIVVFREQRITPEQQIRFARRFGQLVGHSANQYHLPDHPEILVISNEMKDGRAVGLLGAGLFWHSDLSWTEKPASGTLLHAQRLPAEDGDTLFANMYAAYESLPEALRSAVEDRHTVHDYFAISDDLRPFWPERLKPTPEQIAQMSPIVHPIVRTHPETGRKALFVSEEYTKTVVGMPDTEGHDVMRQLLAHVVRPEHVYRHHWQAHDMVLWDNRCLIHRAAEFKRGTARTFYRTTIAGDKPF